MHPLLEDLWVVGLLEKDSYFRVREPKVAVDAAAYLGQGFFDGAERCGPEFDPLVWVGDINDEVADTAAVHDQCSPELIRSWTTLWASSSVRAIAPHPVITAPS